MYKILLALGLALFLFPLANRAQNKCTLRLLMSAEEISKMPANPARLKSVGYSSTGEDIVAYTDGNKKIVLLSNTVWGYQDEHCVVYRNTGGHFFKEEQAGEMIIYSLQSKGFKSKLTTNYYFSNGLGGLVYLLDKENLAEQFKTNACFLAKLKQKFSSPFSYSLWNKKHGSFEIIEMLRSCK